MRIAVVFPGSIYAAWAVSDGLCTTLARMGHAVLQLHRGRPNSAPNINVADLNTCDLVIFSGPEHLFQDLAELKKWLGEIKPPKFAVYHESHIRPDKTFAFPELVQLFDQSFLPAVQDARRLEARAHGRVHFMPFGADTDIFHLPWCMHCKGQGVIKGLVTMGDQKSEGGLMCPACKGSKVRYSNRNIPIGFIGTMYGIRQAFMQQLKPIYTCPVPFMVGNVQVQDIDGINALATAHRLAMNYERILIFVNLPTLSGLLVTKVYESMAAGCCLLTPYLTGDAEKNMRGFDHGKHLIYYKPNAKDLNDVLCGLIKNLDKVAEIGRTAADEIVANHSLRKRMEFVLSFLEKKVENDTPQLVQP